MSDEWSAPILSEHWSRWEYISQGNGKMSSKKKRKLKFGEDNVEALKRQMQTRQGYHLAMASVVRDQP
jgi:hypothetical protein